MGICIVCVVMLACVLGTHAGISSLTRNRNPSIEARAKGLRGSHDMADLGVECTSDSKYKYADSDCSYLECKGTIYEYEQCEDGMGVTDKFARLRSSKLNPCSRPLSKCKKTLAEKGLGEHDTEVCGVDFIILCDMSYSISSVDKMKVRSFILHLIRLFRLGSAFTLVAGSTFGNGTDPILTLDSYNSPSTIQKAIKDMKMVHKKGTTTWIALEEARTVFLRTEKGRRKNKKAIVLTLTDGATNPRYMSSETIRQAKLLKDPNSYEEGVSPPLSILVTVKNSKLSTDTSESGRPITQSEREILTKLTADEFEAIPSGEQNRHDIDNFDQLSELIVPIIRKSCESV